MILAGRVRWHCSWAGAKADPLSDAIEIDGLLVQPVHRPTLVYLLLNKPVGVVSVMTHKDAPPFWISCPRIARWQNSPVGRLDSDSTGALLLTNDGDLTFGLTHPRHSIPKTYHVWVQSYPPESVLQQWRQGVILDGKKTRPAQVGVLSGPNKTCLKSF